MFSTSDTSSPFYFDWRYDTQRFLWIANQNSQLLYVEKMTSVSRNIWIHAIVHIYAILFQDAEYRPYSLPKPAHYHYGRVASRIDFAVQRSVMSTLIQRPFSAPIMAFVFRLPPARAMTRRAFFT